MAILLCVDRFEGRKKEIAVLLTENDRQIPFPRDLLPPEVRAGDMLSVTIEPNVAATKQLKKQTRALQDELKKTDPGGDIQL
jgi:hypothetical protein